MGQAESPVVGRTVRKRESLRDARGAVLWGLVNLVVALTLYLDLYVYVTGLSIYTVSL